MCSLMSPSHKPQQPPEPNYDYISPTYTSSIFGEHKDGNYIKAYIPDTPYRDPETQNLKAVIYLHGFALGVPGLYEAHLLHLVKQGYFVFFPDYQKDNYVDDNPSTIEDEVDLIEAVLESLVSKPEDWINAAITSTSNAFNNVVVPDTAQIQTLIHSNVDVYLFGHSLGGLFALSWPYYLSQDQQKLRPLQVIAVDPVPDSLSNLPLIVKGLLHVPPFKYLNFVQYPISIKHTGSKLDMPVAILHGNDDTIVSPCSWEHPFDSIASPKKKIYFSSSDNHGTPPLSADHNQSVTNTSALLSNWLASALGGAKNKADDLNWRYIWFALDRVIQGAAADELDFDMDKWSDNHPVNGISVSWPKHCRKFQALAASLRQQYPNIEAEQPLI
jgi:hypothetical protein